MITAEPAHNNQINKAARCAPIISFARSFETARGRTSLGLSALGIKLSKDRNELKNKLMYLRRKVSAHSDDEVWGFEKLLHRDSRHSSIS